MKKMIQHDSYMCPICCEILLHPISMECGHLYCMRCFEEYAAYNSQCCICRKVDSVIDLRVLQAADAVIRK